jgi:predicted transcriptional regulator
MKTAQIRKGAQKMIYDFAFVVDADPHDERFEDRFIEAGCDDATFVLLRGTATISFDREASSYKEAVFSAYQQIIATGSQILRFEPDFLVSAMDIAERSGLTRAAVSNYTRGERKEGFPAPHARLTSANPLWDWVAVSKWLVEHKNFSEEKHREALISRIINAGVQIKQVYPDCKIDLAEALEAA